MKSAVPSSLHSSRWPPLGILLYDPQRWLRFQLADSLRPALPNLYRSSENCPYRDEAAKFMSRDRRQAHRRDAPARTAIRIPPELARRNFLPEIGRDSSGRERKHAFVRTVRRIGKLPDHTLRHVELRETKTQIAHFGNRSRSLRVVEHFWQLISNLRRE
jgi:hypothetical protein